MTKYLSSFLVILIFASCSKVYYPNKSKAYTNNHKTFAILPINFDIYPDFNNLQPHMDSYPVDHFLGLAYSEKIYEKLEEEKLNVKLLPMDSVNIYFANRINSGEDRFLINQIPTIAENINADAIFVYSVRSNSVSNSMGELAKDFAMALTTGFYSVEPSNEVKIISQIYDGKSGELIWQYNLYSVGFYFTTPILLVNSIVRVVKNKIPYRY